MRLFFAAILLVSVLLSGLVSYVVASMRSKHESPVTYIPLMTCRTDSLHGEPRALDIHPDLTQAAANGMQSVVQIQVRRTPRLNMWQSLGNRLGVYKSRKEKSGGGSGVIIGADGFIATNRHVIRNADGIRVTLNDNRMFMAAVVGYDQITDLALLKIDTVDLPILPWDNSDDLQVGEWVLAIGSPYGLQKRSRLESLVRRRGRCVNIRGFPVYYTNITQLMKLNEFYKNCIFLFTESNVTKTNGYNKFDKKHACLGGVWPLVRI